MPRLDQSATNRVGLGPGQLERFDRREVPGTAESEPLLEGARGPESHRAARLRTPGLFEELNAINAAAAHVKVLWAGDAVMVEVDLVAESLDLAELANALMVVRATAEKYQGVLSAFFAGPDEIGAGL